MTDRLRHNADLVESLGSAIREGEHGLSAVPLLICRVLEQDSWREFVTRRGEHVEHRRFEQFVTTPPLKGLGANVEMMRRVVRGTPAEGPFEEAIRRPPGRPSESLDNIQDSPAPTGTSRSAALRRLRKDAPELHERVLAGELSANGAMVQAGFKPRTATVRLDDPSAIARALRKRLSPDAIAELVEALLTGGS